MESEQENEHFRITFDHRVIGLSNSRAICCANSFYQAFLHIPAFQQFINTLEPEDPLFKFTYNYFTNTSSVMAPLLFYKKMKFGCRPNDDIEGYFMLFFQNYKEKLIPILGIPDDATFNSFTPYLGIYPEQNIQNSINERLRDYEFLDEFPTVLPILINRFTTRNDGMMVPTFHPIKINMFLYTKSKYYSLQSIVSHNGSKSIGHYVTTIIFDNNIIYANDSNISEAPFPKRYFTANSVLLIYTICSEPPENWDKIFFPMDTIEGSSISPETIGTASDANTDINSNSDETQTTESQQVHQNYVYADHDAINLDEHDEQDQSNTHYAGTAAECALILNYEDGQNIGTDIPAYEEIDISSFATKTHNHRIQSNVHEYFRYLHGYLNTDMRNSPEHEYQCDEPKFVKKAKLLKMFQITLGRIAFNYHVSIGDINASILAEKFHLTSLLPTDQQVVEAGNSIYRLYNSYFLDETIPFPTQDEVNTKIQELLSPMLPTISHEANPEYRDIEELDEHEQNAVRSQMNQVLDAVEYQRTNDGINSFIKLDHNYNWRDRCIDIGEDIIQELSEIADEETNKDFRTKYQENRDDLNQMLWNDYLEYQGSNLKEFAEAWCARRKSAITAKEKCYAPKTVIEYIKKWSDLDGPPKTKPKGGMNKKVTKELINCLITTVLDFPEATDSERTDYINSYSGVFNDTTISESTIDRILKNLKITVKQPSFSPVARNSFGYRIARVLWSKVMKEVIDDKSTLACFIDEAGVVIGTRRRARGFMSVSPCTNKTLVTKKLSVLSCVIPSFGVLNRWFSSSVKSDDYSTFIGECAHVIRRFIGNQETQLVFINDNASIHLTKKVQHTAKFWKINLFYTIPYSPQLNLVAENYFSQQKYNALYRFKIKPNEVLDPKEEELAPKHHHIIPYKQYIMKQWDEENRNHYNGMSAAKVYGAWLTILKQCSEGKPLSGLHVACNANFTPSDLYNTLTSYKNI